MQIIRVGLIFSTLVLLDAQSLDKQEQAFWNAKFGDPKTEFNHGPSRLLVDSIRSLRPSRALDIGMGEGRNTIYLATQGWEITGIDISDVAVSQAKAQAAEKQVSINAIVADLNHYDLGKEQWDLIALFYMHSWYNGTKPASAERLLAALKPGGILVVEGFAGREGYKFQPNELLRDFPNLRVLRYEDSEDEAEWALGKKNHIIRFVAERAK